VAPATASREIPRSPQKTVSVPSAGIHDPGSLLEREFLRRLGPARRRV
jgi:hypothetical protein